MTDRERLESIFQDFGLTIEHEGNSLILRATDHNPKQGGYTDFQADFEFTEEGQFIKMGVWE